MMLAAAKEEEESEEGTIAAKRYTVSTIAVVQCSC